eukprot:g11598.t1
MNQQQQEHPRRKRGGGAVGSSPSLKQLAQLAVVGICVGTGSTANAIPPAAPAIPAATTTTTSTATAMLAFAPPQPLSSSSQAPRFSPAWPPHAFRLAAANPAGGGGSHRAVPRTASFSCMSSSPSPPFGGGASRGSSTGWGTGGGGTGGGTGGSWRRVSSSLLRAAVGSPLLLRPGRCRSDGGGSDRGRGGRRGGGGHQRTVLQSSSAHAAAGGAEETERGRRAGAGSRPGSSTTGGFSWRRGSSGSRSLHQGSASRAGWRGRGSASGFAEAASSSAAAGAGAAPAAAAAAAAAARDPSISTAGARREPVGAGAGAGVEAVGAGVEIPASYKIGADLMADMKRRAKLYKSDWTDGVNRKSLPAIMFLYFACLLPAVAFGGIATQVTQGTLGVIEYVVSCGLGGMAYAMFGGQPMTFIGPTGLTLAFMTSLYSFTSVAGLPFLPVYAWVGLWTSAFLATLAVVGASNLIDFATQFTDDVFNALLSVNFIYEAARSLMRNFSPAVAGFTQAGALMSLNVAIVTYMGCRKTSGALSSKVFNSGFREFLADFGPLVVIIGMSFFCSLPSWSGLLSFLEVPSAFMLCKGRSWIVPIFSVSPTVRLACALPAMLLTSLFFLDQNISSRVVNSPRHKMQKGAAYHQDMLVLGLITGLLSVVGLPWQCAATVQSLNHVRQMATFETTSSTLSPPAGGGESAGAAAATAPVSVAVAGTRSETIESIHETRLTGFCVHALVLGSLALLPQLAKIPMAVVSGIFLYLGRKVMSGNAFLIRVKEMIVDRNLLPSESDYRKVGFGTATKYTAVQAVMLTLLWTLKSFKRTALFFPSVIGLLILVRLFALPKMFTPQDLSELDAAVG